MSSTTFGVIIGNRGFFPAVLARDGRDEMLKTLEKEGYRTVCLTPELTKLARSKRWPTPAVAPICSSNTAVGSTQWCTPRLSRRTIGLRAIPKPILPSTPTEH